MTVDFQKLQAEVTETRQLVQTLLDKLNLLPSPDAPTAEEAPLNVRQAADLLDLTTATVYDLVHKRRIPNHRPGKRLYFLRSELMQWIKDGRRSTTDQLSSEADSRKTRQRGKGAKA